MRLSLGWMLRTLEQHQTGVGAVSFPLAAEQLELRNALRTFVDSVITGAMEPLDSRVAGLEKSVKRLEQFHCEHEFKDNKSGCLESIFCSVCGALHPDWERTFTHLFGFADGEEPVGCLIIDRTHYRTRASKPKKGKK